MKWFLLGVLSAMLLIGIVILGCCSFGLAPVATNSQPLPFERFLAHMALDSATSRQAPFSSPLQPSEQVYTAGAQVYRENCAVCHGLPGLPKPPIAKGEYPPPPQLFAGKGVTDDPPGVTYWKTANGIRLTGMPAFKQSLSNDQMWQVSLLLANADKLSSAVRASLASAK